jgi:hypothetical protein
MDYSRNVGEERFCELPLYGVLRSPLPEEVATWQRYTYSQMPASVAALHDFIRRARVGRVALVAEHAGQEVLEEQPLH